MAQEAPSLRVEVHLIEVGSDLPPFLQRVLRDESLDSYRGRMSESLEDLFIHTAQRVTHGKPMRGGGEQVDALRSWINGLVWTNARVLLEPQRADQVVSEVLAACLELDDTVSPYTLAWALLQIGPAGVADFVERYEGESLWFARCEHCDGIYHLMTQVAHEEQERRREEQRQEMEAMRAQLEAEAAKGSTGMFATLGRLLCTLLGRPKQPAIAGPDAPATSGDQLPATSTGPAAEPAAAPPGAPPTPSDAPSDG